MSIFFILGAGASVDSNLKTYRDINSIDNDYNQMIDLLDYNNINKNIDAVCRPNIILYNENLDCKKVQEIYIMIKKQKPKYLVIVGSTMHFSYLYTFIKKSQIERKNRYNINPDRNYKCKENFICETAYEGLQNLLHNNFSICVDNSFYDDDK